MIYCGKGRCVTKLKMSASETNGVKSKMPVYFVDTILIL